jgi:MYXO-CTERM domain-containing protein
VDHPDARLPTPAVGDLDGDGKLEVAVATRDGWLYVWHTGATEDSIVEWESFHHDNRNTGNLDTKLEQGKKNRTKKPTLDASMCRTKTKTSGTPGDVPIGTPPGCGCRVADASEPRGALALLGLAALLGVARRRSRVLRA